MYDQSAGSPLRIGVVGVFHETNSFAPGMTELSAFQAEWIEGKAAFTKRYHGTRTSMGGVIDAAEEAGITLIPGLYTSTMPSGMVSHAAGQTLIERVRDSVPADIDGLMVILHGAMVSEVADDMEAAILGAIRRKVGDQLPLSVTLDLHANVSEEMVRLTNIMVAYDTYPHIDVYERAIEAFQLLIRSIRGEIQPVMALSQPYVLAAPQAMMTDHGMMKELMDQATAYEQHSKVLNISVCGGFPYSDVPDAGFSFVVLTDGDRELAEKYAGMMAERVWAGKERFAKVGLPAQQAVDAAMEIAQGPVIVVESSDNVGGGSPADATHILQHLIDPPRKSLVIIRDVEAVKLAHRLGVGNDFLASVGGKTDRMHGEPVRIAGRIRLLSDGEYTHSGPFLTGKLARMGRTAVIVAGNLTLVLTEERVAPWDPGHVLSLGLQPHSFHLIVVKSAVAWKTAFGSIATEVIEVDTPGCCSFNLHSFEYRKLKRPIYPLD